MTKEDAASGEEPQYDRLTNRSKEVLRLVGQGLTSKEIADRLGIHTITVNGHIEKAMLRLGVHKRMDAARLLALHEDGGAPPTIPGQRPAAITTVWRRGFLDVLSDAESAADSETLEAALAVLREALTNLHRRLSTENSGTRERQLVLEAAERIPIGRPTIGEVFRLGHRYDALTTLADVAGEEWSPSTYSEYAATLLHYERVLKQFPAWKSFLATVIDENESGEDFSRAVQATKELATSLREISEPVASKALASPELLAELEEMGSGFGLAQPEGVHPISWRALGSVVRDIVESVANIIKAIAEAAVSYLKIASGSFRREVDKEAERDGARAFHWLRRIAKYGLLAAGSTALGTLIAARPEQFAWVAKVIQFITRVG